MPPLKSHPVMVCVRPAAIMEKITQDHTGRFLVYSPIFFQPSMYFSTRWALLSVVAGHSTLPVTIDRVIAGVPGADVLPVSILDKLVHLLALSREGREAEEAELLLTVVLGDEDEVGRLGDEPARARRPIVVVVKTTKLEVLDLSLSVALRRGDVLGKPLRHVRMRLRERSREEVGVASVAKVS